MLTACTFRIGGLGRPSCLQIPNQPDVLRKRSLQELDSSKVLDSAISPGAMQEHLNQMAPPDGSEPTLIVPQRTTNEDEKAKPTNGAGSGGANGKTTNGRSGPSWMSGN